MSKIRTLALFLALTAPVCTAAVAFPPLSQTEQDEIAIAVLKYEKPSHPVYLAIRGHDPSPQFLSRLGSSFYHAYSQQPPHKPGDSSMGLVVGSFILRAPDRAEGELQQVCGALCGCRQSATVQNRKGKWLVAYVKTTMCS